MKKLTIVVMLLVTITLQSQEVINRNIDDFDEIKVFNKIRVTLIKGTKNKVEITGSKKEDVTLKNNEGLLKIAMSIGNLWDDNNTKVIVWYTDLTVIDVNEGSSVIVDGAIVQKDIELRAQEGGTIRSKMDVEHVKIKAITGGIINLEGKSIEQEASITAGGALFARNMETVATQVKISAGGTAEINASKYVKANTNAGGLVKIYGNPKEVDSKSILGGKIVEVN